jgi:hypothetical protein
MCAALLVFPSFCVFCVEPFLAQEKPHHACFEQPNGAKEAIRRLPESASSWLAEDAIYIITPEERCAFLHLNSKEERESSSLSSFGIAAPSIPFPWIMTSKLSSIAALSSPMKNMAANYSPDGTRTVEDSM